MRARVLAVVFLALLAGCNGFGGGQAGADTATLTPAPVPTAESPSIDDPAQVEVERIPTRHQSVLDDASYELVETVRVGPASNATFESRTVLRSAADDEELHFDETVIASPADTEWRESDVWWNGERTFYRNTWSDGAQRYFQVEGPPTRTLLIHSRLRELFAAFDPSSVERRGNATVLEGPVQTGAVPRIDELSAVENATMTVRTDERGVISRMAIGYDASVRDGPRRHVRLTYVVSGVGTTTVEAPPWRDNFDLDLGE